MNSVTPKLSKDRVGKQPKNAATGVGLCCCVFLFSFQVLSHLSSNEALPDFLLQTTESHALYLSPTAMSTGQAAGLIPIGRENYTITPFFFQPVPVNYSDQSLLMTVKGIGPALAKRIVDVREVAGPFIIPKDLLRVNGIGATRLQQFSSQLSFIRDLETH